MSRPTASNVEDAWERASDYDVARALGSLEDYPGQVGEIIQAEALSRSIEKGDVANLAPAENFQSLRRLPGLARSWRENHPLFLGLVCGVLIQLYLVVCFAPPTLIGAMLHLGGVLFVPFICLGVVCWPLRSYRLVLWAALACAVSWTVAFIASRVVTGVELHIVLSIRSVVQLAISLPVKWILVGLPLCGVVFVRNRYWPVYPAGHCAHCGYNLHGLPELRCPECGSPFERDS